MFNRNSTRLAAAVLAIALAASATAFGAGTTAYPQVALTDAAVKQFVASYPSVKAAADKIAKKYNLLLRPEYYLDVEGYDPRIHAVYFCPQLYKYDSEKKLVPLYGEEIGSLIAQALEGGIKERRPWYLPADDLPTEPTINGSVDPEFETLVVDMPKRLSA